MERGREEGLALVDNAERTGACLIARENQDGQVMRRRRGPWERWVEGGSEE